MVTSNVTSITMLKVHENDHFVLTEELEIGGLICWAAPYTTGFDCVLPKGAVIRADSDSVEGATGFTALPCHYELIEQLWVEEYDRQAKKYQGYYFVFNLSDIGGKLRRLSEEEIEEANAESLAQLTKQKQGIFRTREMYRGLLLGTAVADAVGLPFEGIGAARVGKLWRRPLNHRFLLGFGMVSDDTDHAVMVVQGLLESDGDVAGFSRSLAKRLKHWLLTFPAGIGMATLKSIIKLWFFIKPQNSGVFSAGNGPAMRVAAIGAKFHSEPELLKTHVEANTRITHSDPRAVTGTLAVALVSAWIFRERSTTAPAPEEFIRLLEQAGDDAEWRQRTGAMAQGIAAHQSVREFAAALGLEKGVSGYIYSTVPVALYAWYHHFGDYRASVESIVELGGDTDTVAAITGALAGAVSGVSEIPEKWQSRLISWPNGRYRLMGLADALSGQLAQDEWAGLLKERHFAMLLRNIVFLAVVFVHVFRRMLPPY